MHIKYIFQKLTGIKFSFGWKSTFFDLVAKARPALVFFVTTNQPAQNRQLILKLQIENKGQNQTADALKTDEAGIAPYTQRTRLIAPLRRHSSKITLTLSPVLSPGRLYMSRRQSRIATSSPFISILRAACCTDCRVTP
ncbi:hypothetical protein ACTV2B_002448 [Cronobacter turicensis]